MLLKIKKINSLISQDKIEIKISYFIEHSIFLKFKEKIILYT